MREGKLVEVTDSWRRLCSLQTCFEYPYMTSVYTKYISQIFLLKQKIVHSSALAQNNLLHVSPAFSSELVEGNIAKYFYHITLY